jgi:hypothetical protein
MSTSFELKVLSRINIALMQTIKSVKWKLEIDNVFFWYRIFAYPTCLFTDFEFLEKRKGFLRARSQFRSAYSDSTRG